MRPFLSIRFFQFIFSEIKHNFTFSIFFTLSLALGLSGALTIDGFQKSINNTLAQKSRDILGGDLALSARREIESTELNLVRKFSQHPLDESHLVELFSMIAHVAKNTKPTNDHSLNTRLAQIKAIEPNYPFYGKISLHKQLQDHQLHTAPRAWVYPEILNQMGLNLGDDLKIGDFVFQIAGVIENDSAAGISTSMAPRVYISSQYLKNTHLLQPGTLATRTVIFKIPQLSDERLEDLRRTVFKQMPNDDLQVTTHKNSSEQIGRILTYLNDFLGLSSLIGLFLAAMGANYLTQSYFQRKRKDIAILMSLGLKPRSAILFYMAVIVVLGALASIIALFFSILLIPLLSLSLAPLFPFEFQYTLSSETWIASLLIGLFGSLFLCAPQLYQLRLSSPSLLFQPLSSAQKTPWFKSGLLFLPAFILFYFLSIIAAHSYTVAHIFLGTFIMSALILSSIALILVWALKLLLKRSPQKYLALYWSIRDLSRLKKHTISAFVALGLGTLLLNIIPQIQQSIQNEIEDPNHSSLPSLFLFDIQQEQLDAFQKILQQNHTIADTVAPLIRARLTAVNGLEFQRGVGLADSQNRDEENEMRFRNRGFNLSYRSNLADGESLVEGQLFSTSKGQIAEISLEHKFAERLSLKVGDRLTFEVQSVPIQGQVVNLRKVKWTTFQPNFFIIFQPGFLEEAPKTFLATLPSLAMNQKNILQNQIVTELPNISMVDVTQLVLRLQTVVSQMALALRLMSFLCLTVGLMVLYSMNYSLSQSRKWDIGLLKALGAPSKILKNSFSLSSLIITLAATVWGILLSFMTSFAFSWFVLDRSWTFNYQQPIIIGVICILLTWIITSFSLRSSLKTHPRDLLSQ